MTNLDSILKSTDITLSTKVHLVKAMVFPVVMYGCESWTIKKAECWKIDAFELWCWRRLWRVPWTPRRCNQSILKEISPECSLEGLMLKLKTPILWPPDAESWLMWLDPLIFLPPKRSILKSVLFNSILKSITSEINQTSLELWYSVQITLWTPSQKIWAREVPEPRDLRTQSMSSINVNA